MSSVVGDLERLKWDLHNESWYDLEDELTLMNALDVAIEKLKELEE